MSSHPRQSLVSEKELQDLSQDDAQELRAFLDKRRWFEEKLQLIEGLSRIYPFVHPHLATPGPASTDTRPEYGGPKNAEWVLPSIKQIKDWQKERLALEEEILAFDNGDLSRMKRKTRAATLIPLTPSSTHLVSITLDLIVLVDRLMTLLRHRADLLELTALRLQWDNMRWQITLETNKVRAEIDAIARGKGRWVPPGGNMALHTSKNGSIAESGQTASPEVIPATLPSMSSVSSNLSEMSNTPLTPSKTISSLNLSKRDSVTSLSSFANPHSPKRTFHLPLLHSSIVNLEIRQNNMSSTLLARSGKLLDQMIDVAMPLTDLGGINGPEAQEGSGGAVPDGLLDIQDDLENDAKETLNRVEWCKKLEAQWKRADEHYLASIRAKEAGSDALQHLSSALSRPSTSEQHQRLLDILASAQRLLPDPIDSSFPRPSHPSYPEHTKHSSHLVDTLNEAYNEAQTSLKYVQHGVDWYGKLATVSEQLSQTRRAVRERKSELQNVLTFLQESDSSRVRPEFQSMVTNTEVYQGWMSDVPAQISRAKELSMDLAEVNQRLAVEVLRSRKAIRERPFALHESVGSLDEDAVDSAEKYSVEVSEWLATAAKDVSRAEQDLALMPLSLDIRHSMADIGGRLKAIQGQVDELGFVASSDVYASALVQVRLLANKASEEIDQPLERLLSLIIKQERSLPEQHDSITSSSRRLREEVETLLGHISRVKAVAEQREVVEEIEREASRLLNRVHHAQFESDEFRSSRDGLVATLPEEMEAQASLLSQEISSWIQAIPNRVRFMSDTSAVLLVPDMMDEHGVIASSSLRSPTMSAAAPPTAPPTTLPQPDLSLPSTDSQSTTLTDSEARRRINEATSRVQGALHYLRESLSTAVIRRTEDIVKDILIDAGNTVAEAEVIMRQARDHLTKCHTAKISDGLTHVETIGGVEKLCDDFLASGRFKSEKARLSEVEDALSYSVQTKASSRLLAEVRERKTALSTMQDQFEVTKSQIKDMRAQAVATQNKADVGNSEDVFGAVAGVTGKGKTTGKGGTTAAALSQRLASFNLQAIVYPVGAFSDIPLSHRQIPSSLTARRIRDELDAIRTDLVQLAHRSHNEDHEDVTAVRLALTQAEEALPRLDELVRVAQLVKSADEALSRVIDSLDEHQAGNDETLLSVQSSADEAVQTLQQETEHIGDDQRVVVEVERIMVSWSELNALAEEALNPDSASARSIDAVSEASSTFSSHAPSLTRSTIMPSQPNSFKARYAEPRNRAASDTPSRMRIDTLASGLPRLRKLSLGLATPTSPASQNSLSGRSSLPRPSRLSMSSSAATPESSVSAMNTPIARVSRPSLGSSRNSTHRSRQTYVADPKSKLDMAVGKIVNKLKVDVPIRPVGLEVIDEWKDRSGKYWIGAEGRAKLCFCRILRSKTVMVRVGGGWVELSKFLLDHFADSLVGWDPSASGGASIGIGSSTPIPITSASMSATAKATPMSTSTRPQTSSKIPRTTFSVTGTPVKTSQRAITPQPDQNLLTPQRPQHALSTTTPAIQSPNNASANSPLVPLHFMRKASESPPVRQREREKLGVGRRSILGRSPSGNVLWADRSPEKKEAT